MAWVKRNLYFVISCVVAVALLGAAGWYCYTQWQGNDDAWTQLNQAYDQLKQINGEPVTPNKENIDAAHDQARQAQTLANGLRARLTPIPPIPNSNTIDDRLLAFAVSDTIRELTMSAQDSHVGVPPQFAFSFSAQRDKAAYAAGSRDHLARQLGEVKVICDLLFTNRINSLEGLQRERTADDIAASTQNDYIEAVSVTNNNTIVSPYQVTFLSFDQELAGVLTTFANQQHGIMVRSLQVEPADLSPTEGGMAGGAVPYGGGGAVPYGGGAVPYGGRVPYGGGAPGTYGGGVPGAPGTPPGSLGTIGGLPVVVDEKKLRVTMLLELVRILPAAGR